MKSLPLRPAAAGPTGTALEVRVAAIGDVQAYLRPPGFVVARSTLGSDAIAKLRHLDCRHRCVVSLVAMLAAGSRLCLLVGIRRQQSERHWHPGIERYLLQASRRLTCDVVEMRRFAANHRAQRDNRIIVARPR